MLKTFFTVFKFSIYLSFDEKGVPLISTHQFHPKGPLLFSPPNPSVPHWKPSVKQTPQFHTKSPQFHNENPSIQHQKPLISTHPSVQHQKPFSSTLKTPQFHPPEFHTKSVLNWGISVLNRGVLGADKVWSLCGTDLLNWGGLCETEGYSF